MTFRELSLETRMGNIGIKVASEEVTSTLVGESGWDEVTRETVVKAFKKVVKHSRACDLQKQMKD